MGMSRINGGALVARTLAKAGITHVFGLVGHDWFDFYDACLDEKIEPIGTRHELAAVLMADGWARVTGQPGVAIISSGPGHANCVPGTASAFQANSPVLVLSASVGLPVRDRDAVQEIDQIGLISPVTKWARTVHETQRIPEYIAAALRNALSGRTGPTHLTIPSNVISQRVDDTPALNLDPANFRAGGRSYPDPALVERAIDLLAQAERPVAIAGTSAHWAQAGEALAAFAEATQTPVFTLELGRGLMPDEEGFCLGYGDAVMNAAAGRIADADVIFLVGKKMDFQLQFGRPPLVKAEARVIQIDVDGTGVGLNRSVTLGIVGDVAATLGELTKAARGRRWNRQSWIADLRETRARQRRELVAYESSDQTPIHPARVASTVRDLLPAEAYLTIDGGDFCHWSRTVLPARRAGGWQHTFPLGGLGVSLPFAIATKLAHPECPVVNLTGDGAFGFHGMEFETAVRHNVPIVTVVGVDGAWGIEARVQEAIYGPDRTTGSLLTEARYDQVVAALGGHGEWVETPDQIRPAVERALQSGRPSCVAVRTAGITSLWSAYVIEQHRAASRDTH